MDEICDIFVWLCGVATQSIPAVLADWLEETGRQAMGVELMPGFGQAWEEFVLGHSDALAFCERAATITGLDAAPETVQARIINSLCAEEAMLDELSSLPARFRHWLVVDLPEAWYRQAPNLAPLYAFFPPERTIFLAESGLVRLAPDVFYFLSRQANLPMDLCLLLDPSGRRSVQAVNHGLPAHHYINPRLLKREFFLRGYHPRASIHHKPELAK